MHRPVLIVCCAEYERRSSSSVGRTLSRGQSFITACAVKSEADADDEQREHAEDGLLLPAHVVFLLDELGHGQLVRKLEDEFAPVRSF